MDAEQFLTGSEIAMLRSKVGELQRELQWSYKNVELACNSLNRLADSMEREQRLVVQLKAENRQLAALNSELATKILINSRRLNPQGRG